jgi:hypothetical protein
LIVYIELELKIASLMGLGQRIWILTWASNDGSFGSSFLWIDFQIQAQA